MKQKLYDIDSSKFQRLGDLLLEKQGYEVIQYGNCEVKDKTRKGTPDSYCFYKNCIIFIEYTTTNEKN